MKARTLSTPQGVWILLMLATSTVFKLVTRHALLALTFLIASGLSSVAQAESGSSQAIMALIVPPHDISATEEPEQNLAASPQPYYNHEASIQIRQEIDGIVRQVWVSL